MILFGKPVLTLRYAAVPVPIMLYLAASLYCWINSLARV